MRTKQSSYAFPDNARHAIDTVSKNQESFKPIVTNHRKSHATPAFQNTDQCIENHAQYTGNTQERHKNGILSTTISAHETIVVSKLSIWRHRFSSGKFAKCLFKKSIRIDSLLVYWNESPTCRKIRERLRTPPSGEMALGQPGNRRINTQRGNTLSERKAQCSGYYARRPRTAPRTSQLAEPRR